MIKYNIKLIFILLSFIYFDKTYSYRTNNVKSFSLYPIISIGNHCPYAAYATKSRIGDQTDIRLIIDTQNTVTAVAADSCRAGCLQMKNNYKPGTGSVIQDTAITGEYTDGTEYICNQVTDKISIDNSTSKYGYLFNTITTQSKPFSQPLCESSAIKAQGILGLGFNREDSGFVTQYASFNNQSQVYAINLCQNDPRIWMGGFDTRIVDKEIATTPMQDTTYSFNVKNIYIGDRTLYQIKDFIWTTRIDSRTPFLHVPSAVFHQTIQLLTSIKTFSKYFTSRFFIEKSCVLNPMVGMTQDEINELLPTFRIQIPSDRGTSYIELNAVPGYLLLEGGNVCPGMVESLDYNMVLGLPLLRQYLVIFDQENARVGFGKVSEHNCDPGRWDIGEWSDCVRQGTCSMQHRNVSCIDQQTNATLPNTKCPGLRPPSDRICTQSNATKNDTCLTDDPQWVIASNWTECDQICGSGVQKREIVCVDMFGAVTNDSKCVDKQPDSQRLCAVDACKQEYHWDVTEWYGCSSSCGAGTQSRMISCVDSSVWRTVDSALCTSPQPIVQRPCRGQPFCSKVKWDYEPCEPLCYRQYESSESKSKSSSEEEATDESSSTEESSYSASESFNPNSVWQNMVCFNTSNNQVISNVNCKGIPNFDLPRACDCKKYLPKKLVKTDTSNSPPFISGLNQILILLILTIISLLF